ncbi:MAG: hypothetical protein ABWY78_06410 [Microvirga sp.]
MTPATASLPELSQTVESSSIFDRAVCLSVELRKLGTKRKVRTSELRAAADFQADMIHVSKDLIESESLDAIRKHDGSIRAYLESKTSGPALFRTGVYMLSYNMAPEVDDWLTAALAHRANVLIPAFLDAYEADIAAARLKLGDLFNTLEYASPDSVRDAFGASVRYFTLGSPAGMERIRADIFRREEEKAADQWRAVMDESRAVLRAELAELVSHMVERLEPSEDGKKKRFNASTVENLDEFLRDFGKRAIADDPDLQAIVTQAREALSGVSVSRIRDSWRERRDIRAKFEEVKTKLDALVVTGGRVYSFED